MSLLQVEHVDKSFGDASVLRDVSFQINAGEILCLLGPSGCGKSTLLRIIAGLERADAGRVIFDGRDQIEVEVHERGFGLMFQDFALFPHKNVIDNVAFGLRMQQLQTGEVHRRSSEALHMVGLTGFETRDVNELSGGEKQRVALARSLAPQPKLLMLDEPLGSLDRTLREGLMSELRRILKAAGLTSIYVTHDQQEAFAVSDRAAIMNAGRIVQIGTPREVYRAPASAWIARFLGLSNVLEGVLRDDGTIETEIGTLRVNARAKHDSRVRLVIRPDAARVTHTNGMNTIDGTLIERSFRGEFTRALIHAQEKELEFEFDNSVELPKPGARLRLTIDPDSITVIDEQRATGNEQ